MSEQELETWLFSWLNQRANFSDDEGERQWSVQLKLNAMYDRMFSNAGKFLERAHLAEKQRDEYRAGLATLINATNMCLASLPDTDAIVLLLGTLTRAQALHDRNLDSWISAAADTAHERNMARKERDQARDKADTRLEFIDALEASYERLAAEHAGLKEQLNRYHAAVAKIAERLDVEYSNCVCTDHSKCIWCLASECREIADAALKGETK